MGKNMCKKDEIWVESLERCVSKNDLDIVKLGFEINSDALNYNYPNSPGTAFLKILSCHTIVEDEQDICEQGDFPNSFGYLEMNHLEEWMTEMGKLCNYEDQYQLLYDVLSSGAYYDEELE